MLRSDFLTRREISEKILQKEDAKSAMSRISAADEAAFSCLFPKEYLFSYLLYMQVPKICRRYHLQSVTTSLMDSRPQDHGVSACWDIQVQFGASIGWN